MSVSRLQRIADAAAPDDREWLQAALAAWRDGVDLEHALELSGPRAIKRRDAAIRRAGDYYLDLSDWAKAARLEKLRRHIEVSVMPRRDLREPMEMAIGEWIELDRQLRPIRCRRAIFDVLHEKQNPCSQTRGPIK